MNSGRCATLRCGIGLFRSDDAGATWELANDNRAIRQRAFYYTHLFADHQDEDVVYLQNTTHFRSANGGDSTESINNGTHGDFHDLWIDPDDPAHLVVANDGGGALSFDTGGSWIDQEFSTAQFYHVATTAHIPSHVCGYDWKRWSRRTRAPNSLPSAATCLGAALRPLRVAAPFHVRRATSQCAASPAPKTIPRPPPTTPHRSPSRRGTGTSARRSE